MKGLRFSYFDFSKILFCQPVKQAGFLLGILYFALASCANRVTPGGGTKDTTPPKELEALPANHSVNFNSKKIEIQFDEYIQLKDQSKQLIISPIIKPAPEISVNKKKIIVELNPDSLLANTTYTLNFGSAVTDIHEDNALENYQYVFSTGSYIDSFYVQGVLKNAMNLKTEKGILVMLYRSTDDSVVYQHTPDYFSRTDTSGNFKITNVAAGSYRVFALKDENQNYLFDSQKEKIAFEEKEILIPDSSKIEMRFFEEIPATPHIKSKTFELPGKLTIVFNRPIENLSFKFVEAGLNSDNLIREISLGKDSLILWNTDTIIDSLNLVFYSGSSVIDTILQSAKGKESKTGRGETKDIKKLGWTSNGSAQTIDFNKPLSINFLQPVREDDLSVIQLFADSITRLTPEIRFADSLKTKLIINETWKEKSSYRLFIPSSAFKSIYGYANDTIQFTFKPKEETSYGSLKVKLVLPEENQNYILQLVDDKEVIVTEKKITASGSYTFNFLDPASLKMKLVQDRNANGKWDTGNYIIKRQPEKVVYFNDEIKIRSNWDLEQEWNVKIK